MTTLQRISFPLWRQVDEFDTHTDTVQVKKLHDNDVKLHTNQNMYGQTYSFNSSLPISLAMPRTNKDGKRVFLQHSIAYQPAGIFFSRFDCCSAGVLPDEEDDQHSHGSGVHHHDHGRNWQRSDGSLYLVFLTHAEVARINIFVLYVSLSDQQQME